MGEGAGWEGWIEAGSEALGFQGGSGFVGFENVEGGVADRREIEGGIGLPGSAPVLVEGHVHRPVEDGFDAPMGARRGEDGFRVGRQGGDGEPGFEAFGAAFLVDPPRGDGGERMEPLPLGMARGEPACVGGAASPLLDPSVAGVGVGFRNGTICLYTAEAMITMLRYPDAETIDYGELFQFSA